MIWMGSFIVSLIVILVGVLFAFQYRKIPFCRKNLDLTRIFIVTVFLAATVLFFPVYMLEFCTSKFGVFKGIILSLHNSIRLFVVDGDFQFIFDNKDVIDQSIFPFYELLMGLLFICAPILTFSFVLTFFKDLQANLNLTFTRKNKAFVFSELNERTILLAESCIKKNEDALIIFTDVFADESEEYYELSQKVNEIGGLCFKKDITQLKLQKYATNKELTFFLCSDETEESMKHFITLNDAYKDKENCSLYFFSSSSDSELVNQVLDERDGIERKIKVRRINEPVLLVYNYLYEKGVNLFNDAKELNNHISIVINGLDNYGTEMLKGLIWFCSMKDFTYEINCFDTSDKAEKRLRKDMPEIFLCDEGKNKIDPEVRYNVKINSNVDFDSADYVESLKAIKNPTFVFTSLGSDEKNVEVSTYIKRIIDREYFIKTRKESELCRFVTIVGNDDENKALNIVLRDRNKDEFYESKFEFIGSDKAIYSYDFIEVKGAEKAGYDRHIAYYVEEKGRELTSEELVKAVSEFYGNEYHYKSSISSAIHIKLRGLLDIDGANILPNKRSDNQKKIIERIEHDRWSAYMRTEGFIYNETKRSGLKLHDCLVPFDSLSKENKDKDNV